MARNYEEGLGAGFEGLAREMRHHRNFPITLSHPITDEDIEAECSFYFCKGFPATKRLPAEHPVVELMDVFHGGQSIMGVLSPSHIKGIEGEILECMLED